jgi:hypothetical protein
VKKTALFGLHVALAMVFAMIVGGMLCIMAGSWFGKSKNPWIDVPYSPLVWGSAFILGLVVSRFLRDPSAMLVWAVGVAWLILLMASDSRGYNPRWCMGCSLSQYLWYSYFSYWNCSQECLGQALGTAPMLNCVAYSLGAVLSLKVKGSSG